MECLVYNGTHHSLQSFRYGIRYIIKIDNTVLLKDGFEGSRRYSSGNIDRQIQPGETLVVLLAAPKLPVEVGPDQVFPVIEVMSVWHGNRWD